MPLRYLAPIAALVLLLLNPREALAARSIDSCTGFIDSLPATLDTPGTWCLRRDLSTGITSGAAITIAANDVTVDCNDFKLGNQAAGPATTAYGVFGNGFAFTSIRNCSVRGFFTGVYLLPGQGIPGRFLVEDNRFDGNLHTAVRVLGGVIRRNTVVRTGRSQVANVASAYGIHGDGATIVDNTVQDVAAVLNSYPSVVGITSYNGVVRNNHVSGLVSSRMVGIEADYADIRGNIVQGPNTSSGAGIKAMHGTCRGNIVAGFEVPLSFCADLGNTAVALPPPPPPPPPPEEI